MSLITEILERNNKQLHPDYLTIPEHKPEMLLIGCVDARKDPIDDLGVPKGKALILRNIAALIRGTSVAPEQRETEAAALEFAVKVMKVKHIAVMGHTDCGGIRASLEEVELTDIKNYLSPLKELRQKVRAADMPHDEKLRLLEKEAVRMSVENLQSYDYIKDRIATGELSIHGWIVDLSNGKLIEIV